MSSPSILTIYFYSGIVIIYILETSLFSMMIILLVTYSCSSDAITQISSLL